MEKKIDILKSKQEKPNPITKVTWTHKDLNSIEFPSMPEKNFAEWYEEYLGREFKEDDKKFGIYIEQKNIEDEEKGIFNRKNYEKTFDFKINKFEEKEFVKKVITLASASWHNAILSFKDDNFEYVDKNIYHALRILNFGNQIKTYGRIIDYGSSNKKKTLIYDNEEITNPKDWYSTFIEMSNSLKI